MREAIEATHREIEILGLAGSELLAMSRRMKLSLSEEDMLAVQELFGELGRDPTDVELEVIAQTWSEHCKHRIFGALILLEIDGREEEVDGLFRTYVKAVTEAVMEDKPGFVLSAFHDNAGFIRVDGELAACLKVETHNHPSAIEPYAGANTGLGGVIRDILGAGQGAQPVASLDVFCVGLPDTRAEDIKAKDVIHPLGIFRGVVRGVRDYGNRMGIPTIAGALQFDDSYLYNPLVFCGTMGVLPVGQIDKRVEAGHLIVAAGGRTGRDGLKGATFSSAGLSGDSHDEDRGAVQIGNPIEEKKVADFLLEARARGLVRFVTDCGAGGFSSACGEMLEESGGQIWLENAPLKAPGLSSFEIYLSESQERMVLAVERGDLAELRELAETYGSEISVLGEADNSGILKVDHHGHRVVELECSKLHGTPRRVLRARATTPSRVIEAVEVPADLGGELMGVLGDFAVCSRSPVIREYDFEVQGNTLIKPLAGASGDAPQDATVVAVNERGHALALSVALLPEWGKRDPYRMGAACVDECVRQLACVGVDPDEIALLDNFCLGNPEDPDELGALVQTCRGMAEVAVAYGAPFVSGKDSFYNFFETEEGIVSIPPTLLVSGYGVLQPGVRAVGASLRRPGSALYVGGVSDGALGGSVWARRAGVGGGAVPETRAEENLACYRALHEAIVAGEVLAAHDISEGGLAVALAEMAFSGRGGIQADLDHLPVRGEVGDVARLFGEGPGRMVLEAAPGSEGSLEARGFVRIGQSDEGGELVIRRGGRQLIRQQVTEIKLRWQEGLKRYY
jgi:phosphoribosylformylglycinamidine synthase II